MNGDRLRDLRVANGIKVDEMAAMLDVSLRTYQSYERNERDPSTVTLAKLVVIFGVSADYLIGTSDIANIPIKRTSTSADLDALRQKIINAIDDLKTEQSLYEIIAYIDYLIYRETGK